MKVSRFLLWLIAILVVSSALIDLPEKLEITFPWGKNTVKRIIAPPEINLNLGFLKFNKSFDTRLGLDLSGGTHLVMEADMSKITASDRDNAYESALNTVERRINLYGLTEPVIQKAKVGDSYRIIIEIPGISESSQAIDLIGATAQLTFREESSDSASIATPSSFLELFPIETGLTGKNLKRSQVVFDPNSGTPEVGLEFDGQGGILFEELTARNIGKMIAIFLDDNLLSSPRVSTKITGGQAVIQGQFTLKDAKNLSILLNAGALPVPLKVVEQRHIGATLGEQTVNKSLLAGVIGLSTVALFMVVNYGFLGVVADIALIIYALIVWAIFKTVPITLTLAGIAGFILSIGMAVDANILIFERMKEEVRWGRDYLQALRLGFDRAYPSIRDSNLSSLITCAILFWFGTGIVRGFALTLGIGIIVSFFSAIIITRTFLKLIHND